MSVKWTHVLLVAGIGSMLLEIFIPAQFGFVGIGVGFLSAALMTHLNISPWIQVPVATALGFITIILFRKLIKPQSGIEFTPDSIVGKTGIVKKVLNGKVLVVVDGEEWVAYNTSLFKEGEEVKVIGIEGNHLKITRPC